MEKSLESWKSERQTAAKCSVDCGCSQILHIGCSCAVTARIVSFQSCWQWKETIWGSVGAGLCPLWLYCWWQLWLAPLQVPALHWEGLGSLLGQAEWQHPERDSGEWGGLPARGAYYDGAESGGAAFQLRLGVVDLQAFFPTTFWCKSSFCCGALPISFRLHLFAWHLLSGRLFIIPPGFWQEITDQYVPSPHNPLDYSGNIQFFSELNKTILSQAPMLQRLGVSSIKLPWI